MVGGKGSKSSEIGELASNHSLENHSSVFVDLGYSAPDRKADERIVESRDYTAEAAIRILEALRIDDEELALSKEQISSNEQRQEDEMLALEAIYGDSVVSLDRKGGLRLFQIYIHYEVVDDYIVCAKLYSSTMMLKGKGEEVGLSKENNSDGFLYTFKVQHLPPLVLTCLFPSSYPSHHSPYFTVYSLWLDSMNISSICQMMDVIWMDQVGQEVLHQWVEWMKNSSLFHLGFADGVMLAVDDDDLENRDSRAVSGLVSLEHVIPRMISHNDERNRKVFLNNLQMCVICFNEYAGSDFVKLPCQHLFCFKCMETYSSTHVKEGTVTRLLCPDTKCGGIVPPNLLQTLLGSETYERWESLILKKALDSMKDVVYCPRCETACLEDEENDAQCSNCFFSFCSICRDRRHLGVQCMTPEMKLLIFQGRQKSTYMDENQKRKEKDMINDILSVNEALSDAKQCPSCKIAISRTGGCNKMVCVNCGNYLCFNCGKAIDGYDHFKEEGCQLFPPEEIAHINQRRWDANFNERQLMGQIRAQLHPRARHNCPSCGQMNAKVRPISIRNFKVVGCARAGWVTFWKAALNKTKLRGAIKVVVDR